MSTDTKPFFSYLPFTTRSSISASESIVQGIPDFLRKSPKQENGEERLTTIQRGFIMLNVIYEAYRTLISSYLIVFVPRNCDGYYSYGRINPQSTWNITGGYSCSIVQNITPSNEVETAAIAFNTIAAFFFCALFYIERRREMAINRHLICDSKSPTDKHYLTTMISSLEDAEKNDIIMWNGRYRNFAKTIPFVFLINAGISSVVVYNRYLNNTTAIVFITNVLFMINRIYKAHKIASFDDHAIYSAYRTEFALFNRARSSWLQTETIELEKMNGLRDCGDSTRQVRLDSDIDV